MTERTDEKLNFVKIEVTGFQDLCNRLKELEAENEKLEAKTERQRRMINGLRINNSSLTLERNKLIAELQEIKGMSMFEFGNTYCSSESLEADGHEFARALLGGR